MLKIGDYEVSVLISDDFALDGGSMFGSVPKTLWSKSISPDELNRIPLTCRLLVLKKDQQLILVDVGCGNKWDDKLKKIYAIENKFADILSKQIPAVTDIILTHLHFDHAGAISHYDQNNKLQLTFPTAKVYLQAENFQNANNPNAREKASYLTDHVGPLSSANLHLVNGNKEILPGIFVECVNGHTKGLQWILVRGEQQSLAYPSDLIPTAHHLPLPYVMGYDMCAEKSLEEKQNFLNRAVAEKWIVVFEHDRETAAGVVAKDDKGRHFLETKVPIPQFVSS